jgi:AcrR family transcriptional regulator
MQTEAPKPRKPRRAPDEIRHKILQAAGEEFKACGYTGATTLNIARRADVTEAQLFRYFATKSVLFREAVFEPLVQHFDAFDARHKVGTPAGANIRENARIYISELQQFIREHSKMLMSLVVAQTYAPFTMPGVGEIDSLQSYFARGAALMQRTTGEKVRVAPKLMVRVSFAAVLACVLFKDWMFPAGLAGEAEISEAIIDFVIDGITVDLDPALESSSGGLRQSKKRS